MHTRNVFVDDCLRTVEAEFILIDAEPGINDISKDFRKLNTLAVCAAACDAYDDPELDADLVQIAIADGLSEAEVLRSIAGGHERAQVARQYRKAPFKTVRDAASPVAAASTLDAAAWLAKYKPDALGSFVGGRDKRELRAIFDHLVRLGIMR